MVGEVRIGVCGTGSFGMTRARTFALLPGARVVAGWSRSAATRERFSQELGAAAAVSWKELCTADDVDAVLICTPNAEHSDQARAALEAGKHVLVETPLALNHGEARQLAGLSASRGRVLHHGTKWRYHPDHDEHIGWLHAVGELLFAFEHAAFDFGPDRPWYADAALTGGARAFLPYLMVDWLEAFGEVERAAGTVAAQGDWRAASVSLRFAAGGQLTLGYAVGLGLPEVSVRQVVGTEGSISSPAGGGQPVLTRGQDRTELARREVDIVECECRAFLDEIEGRRDHREPLARDVRAWELVDAALERTTG